MANFKGFFIFFLQLTAWFNINLYYKRPLALKKSANYQTF